MTVTNDTAPASSDTADRLDPALLKLAGIVLVGAVAVQPLCLNGTSLWPGDYMTPSSEPFSLTAIVPI